MKLLRDDFGEAGVSTGVVCQAAGRVFLRSGGSDFRGSDIRNSCFRVKRTGEYLYHAMGEVCAFYVDREGLSERCGPLRVTEHEHAARQCDPARQIVWPSVIAVIWRRSESAAEVFGAVFAAVGRGILLRARRPPARKSCSPCCFGLGSSSWWPHPAPPQRVSRYTRRG